jgi:hypothetical protein
MSSAGTNRPLSAAAISEGLAEEFIRWLVDDFAVTLGEELGLMLEDDVAMGADEVGATAELETA